MGYRKGFYASLALKCGADAQGVYSNPPTGIRQQTNTMMACRSPTSNPRTTVTTTKNIVWAVFDSTVHSQTELTLPLAAMTWVGSKVFLGYYASDINTAHYLGVDFTIHSSLLIAMTWLIPFFILKKAQPSLQKSALKGLNKGLQNAFNHLEAEVLRALAQQSQHQQTLAAELK